MSTKVEVHTNSHNLVEFWGPIHKTVAELDRKTGEWHVWSDGRRITTRDTREAAVDEAARLASRDDL